RKASPQMRKLSMLDYSISRNSSSTRAAFNNLINICASLILLAILTFLELHIRRSILHLHPAVVRNTNDGEPGISLRISAQANAVERKTQERGSETVLAIPPYRPSAALSKRLVSPEF